jgi:hypothetical protein
MPRGTQPPCLRQNMWRSAAIPPPLNAKCLGLALKTGNGPGLAHRVPTPTISIRRILHCSHLRIPLRCKHKSSCCLPYPPNPKFLQCSNALLILTNPRSIIRQLGGPPDKFTSRVYVKLSLKQIMKQMLIINFLVTLFTFILLVCRLPFNREGRAPSEA